jgi:hypothetical protein
MAVGKSSRDGDVPLPMLVYRDRVLCAREGYCLIIKFVSDVLGKFDSYMLWGDW